MKITNNLKILLGCSLFIFACAQDLGLGTGFEVAHSNIQKNRQSTSAPDNSSPQDGNSNGDNSKTDPSNGGTTDPNNGNSNSGTGSATSPASKIVICSKLNFDEIVWPSSINETNINAFALGLNISSSYEGYKPVWNTITNNFDGMGLSLGLFQQNLGSESLQPMLMELKEKYNIVWLNLFKPDHRLSIEQMLSDWRKQNPITLKSVYPEYKPKINLDEENTFSVQSFNIFSTNNPWVRWALGQLYIDSGIHFDSVWSRELTQASDTREYKNIQMKYAFNIHTRAKDYFDTLKFKKLKSYLMLLDIVVQNGSLNHQEMSQYAIEAQAHPKWSEEDKLKSLLEIRLQRVRKQYVEDVRSRKMTIINGSGVVHQTKRNLEQEYCYNGQSTL